LEKTLFQKPRLYVVEGGYFFVLEPKEKLTKLLKSKLPKFFKGGKKRGRGCLSVYGVGGRFLGIGVVQW